MTTRAVRISTIVTVMTLAALVAGGPAGADPARMPAPGIPTSTPNPSRDPVPAPKVCGNLEDINAWETCLDKCDGVEPLNSYRRVPRNTQACDEMGRNEIFGLKFGTNPRSAPNYAEGLRYFGYACNPLPGSDTLLPTTAFWAGCYDLGILNSKGEGMPVNLPAARELFVRACGMAAPSLTYAACFAAGQMFEDGTGGAKDVGAAVDAYRKACDASYPRACAALFHLQPTLRVPGHLPPGTPTSIPTPPRTPPPRGTPVPPRAQ